MSTLKVDTLTDTGNVASVPIEDVINGSARAWVNFNGTGTVAIRGSYNVTSITDNGTGDYTANFTTALTDTNYSVNLSFALPSDSGGQCFIRSDGIATSSVRVKLMTSDAAANIDRAYVYVAVFR